MPEVHSLILFGDKYESNFTFDLNNKSKKAVENLKHVAIYQTYRAKCSLDKYALKISDHLLAIEDLEFYYEDN